MNPLPDWKLPAGTSQGLMAYVTAVDLARQYDGSLEGSPLLQCDLRYCEQMFPSPGRLIDLGCGTGRLLLPFARQGFKVLGVDLSAEMLSVAATKVREAGLSVALVQMNIVELDAVRDGSFDYAACLFSTLGMVVGMENRRQVLTHIFRVLRPGGRLVLHVHHRWHHLKSRVGRRWLLRDLGRRIRGAANVGDYEMPTHGTIAGLTLHQFSRREILGELRHAGFGILDVEPVSLRADCKLPLPWLLPGLRAYGFLITAERPAG